MRGECLGSRDGGLLGFLRAVRTQSPGGRREHHPVTHCHCDRTEVRMSSTVETATEIRPFHVEVPEDDLDDLRRRIAATRWPREGARRRSVAGRAAGDDAGARALLGDRVRLARVRGEAERAAAVHDRDRRGGHPLHPREVAARERAAADHDARLARLGHRAARDRRPAHRPDRARRTRRGRVRPRAAVPARLRLLRRAGRARLERRPRRAGLGGADAPPRLHPLRRPGRRRGRRSSPTRWAARRPRGCSAST